MPYLQDFPDQAPPPAGLMGRYISLRTAHGDLERVLAEEMKRPRPDTVEVQRLKRRKLLIKDELAAIDRLFAAIGTSFDEAMAWSRSGKRLTSKPATKNRHRTHGQHLASPIVAPAAVGAH